MEELKPCPFCGGEAKIMPVVCENRCSLQARIDKAIVDTVLGFVEVRNERL